MQPKRAASSPDTCGGGSFGLAAAAPPAVDPASPAAAASAPSGSSTTQPNPVEKCSAAPPTAPAAAGPALGLGGSGGPVSGMPRSLSIRKVIGSSGLSAKRSAIVARKNSATSLRRSVCSTPGNQQDAGGLCVPEDVAVTCCSGVNSPARTGSTAAVAASLIWRLTCMRAAAAAAAAGSRQQAAGSKQQAAGSLRRSSDICLIHNDTVSPRGGLHLRGRRGLEHRAPAGRGSADRAGCGLARDVPLAALPAPPDLWRDDGAGDGDTGDGTGGGHGGGAGGSQGRR